MAKRPSVAVADRDQIALGLGLPGSADGPDFTVAGKLSLFASERTGADDLDVLDPHAARTRTQQRAAASAPARRMEWMDDISCSVSSLSVVTAAGLLAPGSALPSPSQASRPSGMSRFAPRSQWRHRAGLPPAFPCTAVSAD